MPSLIQFDLSSTKPNHTSFNLGLSNLDLAQIDLIWSLTEFTHYELGLIWTDMDLTWLGLHPTWLDMILLQPDFM